KTMKKSESKLLRRVLLQYHRHFTRHPHSLISRYYGMFKIVTGTSTHYLCIMNNITPSYCPVNRMYDLKGSWVGRTSKMKDPLHPPKLLKDNNVDRPFILSPRFHALLCAQLTIDSKFLSDMNFLDYSMLLGVASGPGLDTVQREDQERHTNSIPDPLSPNTARQWERAFIDADAVTVEDLTRFGSELIRSAPGKPLKSVFESWGGGIPGGRNVLGDERYLLGVIDIFTEWSNRKAMENSFKGLVYDKKGVSAVPPPEYAQRFCTSLSQLFTSTPPGERHSGFCLFLGQPSHRILETMTDLAVDAALQAKQSQVGAMAPMPGMGASAYQTVETRPRVAIEAIPGCIPLALGVKDSLRRDAARLYKEIKGLMGGDETVINNVLSSHTVAENIAIATIIQEEHKKDLRAWLQKKTHGNYRRLCLALITPKLELEAAWIRECVKGKNIKAILECIIPRSTIHLRGMIQVYDQLFEGGDMVGDILSVTKGKDLIPIMKAILGATRGEESAVVVQDVRTLRKAIRFFGTRTEDVAEVFFKRNRWALEQSARQAYTPDAAPSETEAAAPSAPAVPKPSATPTVQPEAQPEAQTEIQPADDSSSLAAALSGLDGVDLSAEDIAALLGGGDTDTGKEEKQGEGEAKKEQ
ncbi:phosphatidylinositol-4-phosphate 5-kinase, partial [Kipferlia bialata]